jgi:putative ABC transport system permease protein
VSLSRLVLRNILDSLFRSSAILLCAALVSGLGLTSTLVVRGAEEGLRSNLSRMGADIIVIPWGTMSQDWTGAHLMGMLTERWMPRAYMDRLALVRGVAQVSPQLYLATLRDTRDEEYSGSPEAYSGRSAVYLVAYDPATDFALKPWLGPTPPEALALGEAVAGALVMPPEGPALADGGLASAAAATEGDAFKPAESGTLDAYGFPLRIVGRLEPTGGDIDQTLFVSFETAQALFVYVQAQPKPAFEIAPESISTAMIKVDVDNDPHEVAIRILEQVSSVVPIESTGFFQTQRAQMVGLLRTVLVLLASTWLLSALFVGLVFSLAANERRRQIGVLRALGATAITVFRSLLVESIALAVVGGTAGVGLAILAVQLFGEQLAALANIHVHLPPTPLLLALAGGGLLLAVLTVTPAVWIPARRISAEEPSLAMRE